MTAPGDTDPETWVRLTRFGYDSNWAPLDLGTTGAPCHQGEEERVAGNKRELDSLGGSKAIRERLEVQRDEILKLYEKDIRAGQAAADEGSDDIVDRANNAYNRELLFALSDGERVTLLRIENALERLEGGLYGSCAHCEKQIGVERLKAVPWAQYCIDCQELAEKGMLEER